MNIQFDQLANNARSLLSDVKRQAIFAGQQIEALSEAVNQFCRIGLHEANRWFWQKYGEIRENPPTTFAEIRDGASQAWTNLKSGLESLAARIGNAWPSADTLFANVKAASKWLYERSKAGTVLLVSLAFGAAISLVDVGGESLNLLTNRFGLDLANVGLFPAIKTGLAMALTAGVGYVLLPKLPAIYAVGLTITGLVEHSEKNNPEAAVNNGPRPQQQPQAGVDVDPIAPIFAPGSQNHAREQMAMAAIARFKAIDENAPQAPQAPQAPGHR